ncbi:unnamed protein product, partial [marine sediment metagenome]
KPFQGAHTQGCLALWGALILGATWFFYFI